MANFTIPETPEFTDQIRMFETTDPGHADVFNPVIKALLENEVYLNRSKSETGTCSSVHGATAKTVDCPGFELQDGARIMVTFNNGNTSNYFTMNVNGTGAFAVWFPVGSTRSYNDKMISKYIVAGCAYEFIFQNGKSPKWVYCGVAGGVASTAEMLSSGRNIQLSGAVVNSNNVSFDGSRDIIIPTKYRGLEFGGHAGWYKIAALEIPAGDFAEDTVRLVLKVDAMNCADGGSGILTASIWMDKNGYVVDVFLLWEYVNDIDPEDFQIAYPNAPWGGAELWAYTYGQTYRVTVMSEGSSTYEGVVWTLRQTLLAGDPPDSTELPEGPEGLTCIRSSLLSIRNPAAKWTTARNINGMMVDGSGSRFNYGICTTAAATSIKVVECDGFALSEGAEITVKFTVTNISKVPMLNVNRTGAKPVHYKGDIIPAEYLSENSVLSFRYDSGAWRLVGGADAADGNYASRAVYGDNYISLGRSAGGDTGNRSIAYGGGVTASGELSCAFGDSTTAGGYASHAEGSGTDAGGEASHAEGNGTTAGGKNAHAEGNGTTAGGYHSHAEGSGTTAGGYHSHAEGNETTAGGYASHAEGRLTTAERSYSHAEGYHTAAGSDYAHAEGNRTTAAAEGSHAEGYFTAASGNYAHAEGSFTAASGNYAHAEGYHTTASSIASHAAGRWNKPMNDNVSAVVQAGDAFVIGNGVDNENMSNALRVTFSGEILGTKSFQSSGADYAEFIKPWADGNPDSEDRVGYFVTVRGGLLYKAEPGDYIAGITSGNPSVVGNADEDYYWRYERDEFRRIVMEDVPEMAQKTDNAGNPVYDEETGEPVMAGTGNIIKNARMKLAGDYDPSRQNTYVPRKDRKEWDYVGMAGVIPVRDDGTCLPDRFCRCGKGGTATLAEERGFDTFYVIERISENVVSVELR